MANITSQGNDESLDLSTVAIPDSARMRAFPLTMAWWAVCSAVFYIVVGAALALGYGARNALIGMVLSVISYGLVNAVLSRYAIRTGQSVSLFSRQLFGSAGAAIATLIFFATAIYYAVFEGSVIAVAAHNVWPALDYKWAALIVVLYSVPLVFGSVQNWLDKFNGVLLPVYLIGLFTALALTTWQYGYHANWLDFGPKGGAPAGGWWHCYVYYMGVWVLMLYTFDYARFGRKEDATYHGRFNFGMPFYAVTFLLNGAAGIYLVSATPDLGPLSEVSVVIALLKLMGVWGLLFIWATQSRINTANYYLATINMQAFFEKTFRLGGPKFVWAIVVGVVVYILMYANVFSTLLQALAYQGIFVVAWVAVALSHILSGRIRQQLSGNASQSPDTRVPLFNPGGLTAWSAGVIAGLVLNGLSGFIHSFSAPATFIASFLFYRLMLAVGSRRSSSAGNT